MTSRSMHRLASPLSALTLSFVAALAGCGGPEDGMLPQTEEIYPGATDEQRQRAMRDSDYAAQLEKELQQGGE
ncbi:hypothetical protein [Alienimonas chondri]|uniref:Secreted protein n=1 Tax=Alienimonas chondri TaxID=2681879 RepID=A0ABX1VJG4_9PLAN|nr:hypothetical protein [Alienimonas chondri]NNJ27413.1 hypothetical protein [Alienimonas chondri]